jgi:hypothetical protein
MNRKIPQLLCLALLAAIPAAHAAEPQATSPSRLRVSVFNDARVPESELSEAERTASATFEAAGVSVEWLNCGRASETSEEQRACSEVNFPERLVVRILPHPLNLKPSAFGISYLGQNGVGTQVDVFYQGLARLCQSGRVPQGMLLGAVMAHELGHLLLGTNSHAPVGLMRASWNADDLAAVGQGNLHFTAEQTQSLRVRLQSFNHGARGK